MSLQPNIIENGGIQPAKNLTKYKPLVNKYIKKISSGRRPTKSNRRKLDKFTGRNF